MVGFLIFVVVIVIVVIFGIIPPVAQKALDKTTLEIETISILKPEPTKFEFSVTSYITGSSKMAHSADIDPMEVAFYLEDQEPFMYLPLPGVHGGDKILVQKLNHTTDIVDAKTFGTFAGTLMDTEQFEMGIRGNTKIHLGAIKTKVKYREWVNLKGFNKLDGMVIIKYTPTPDDEYRLTGQVVIPNPTVFTLELGDVMLDLELDGKPLGNGILPNLIISPGLKNVYEFKANMDDDNAMRLLMAVASGPTTLQVHASDVKVKGNSIPWLAAPLGAVVIDVPIDTNYKL